MSLGIVTGCKTTEKTGGPQAGRALTLTELQKAAIPFGEALALPQFERTPSEIAQSLSNALQRANTRLDEIGARPEAERTFVNTVRALDDLLYEAGLTANRLAIIKDTSPDAAMREAATEAIKQFEEWAVGIDYREDVYRAVKSVADRHPPVQGEDAKFLKEVLRDYRRAGLELPPKERAEVERLRKELARLSTDYENNILKAKHALKFTRAELEGVPESFLNQKGIQTGPDEYTILANVTYHYITVMRNARREDTREKLCRARFSLAMKENVPLLKRILRLRETIAHKLGYATWADYKIEPKMAKDAATARAFCEQLTRGLEKRFQQELQEFARMKARDTGRPVEQIAIWDWRYYANELKKEKYDVDSEQLRVFFPYDKVLEGMFHIYQHIFGLKFVPVEPPYKWVDDLQLYGVLDAESGEPLGLFYLDMFPREGKYNHFAQYGIIEGKRLPDGRYQRPVVALVCNFPTPQPDRPSLLTHSDVETLFHEFGHAMHSILTRANYARFSGTSVPRDFVEAPSQMLENWVWDKNVLDTFAADYRDPSRKIPQEILDKLKEAKLATIGSYYRRQMAFALTDLALHTEFNENTDPVALANEVFGRTFLPPPKNSAFVAFFGHLMGYDAAYYGYAWADAIAADLATAFEQSPQGYFDAEVGRRLRREIYEPGDSRDVNESIRRFLGRERSLAPFFKKNGIELPAGAAQ